MSKKTALIAFLAIVALASFFRLWEIKSIPPGFSYDEAMYANNAVEAWETSPPAGGFKVFYTENNGREGLWINMLAPVLAIFGENEPWVSRTFAAIFGILTVLGLYFLTKALFKSERLALLSSFFMAVSFWHINFSRIGFRAILTPFFLVWSFYFLWLAYEKGKTEMESKRGAIVAATIGGILFGLGFHTYISFRVAPLLLIVPFILMWRNKQKKLILIFLFFTFIVALPIGLYFLGNPQDFFGRSSQVSIFAGQSSALTLGSNIVKTIGMFFVWGDGNWRHNLRGAPELWWPVAVLFLIGIWQIVKRVATRMKIVGVGAQNFREAKILGISNFQTSRGEAIFLLLWLVVLLIPTVISSEGLPHALRSIGVIPAIMILAAIGLEWIIVKISDWLRKKMEQYPEKREQLLRIKKELSILLIIFLLAVASEAFNQYFFRWAGNPRVADAFNENYVQLGKYLNSLPKDLPKYIIMNCDGNMFCDNPYQPPVIMFITKTYIPDWRVENNIFYINPAQMNSFIDEANKKEHLVVTMLNVDPFLRTYLKEKIPNLNINSDQDFGVISLYK
ncbi:MAG: glycosyltransferase family 39 protein [bacterium]|nr:glycosyltransferase family 39 protein [bacterium]